MSNKLISSLVIAGVLATTLSSAALAGDHRSNNGGNGAAIAAGILGAVVIGSIIANSQPSYASAPQPYPVYQAPPQVYYPPAPVRRTYYVAPRPYYAPQRATVIQGRYGNRHEHRDSRRGDRYGYYSR